MRLEITPKDREFLRRLAAAAVAFLIAIALGVVCAELIPNTQYVAKGTAYCGVPLIFAAWRYPEPFLKAPRALLNLALRLIRIRPAAGTTTSRRDP